MMSYSSLLRAVRWSCGAAAAALLAACGGGEQVSKFSAQRVIAFGDESSVIDDFRHDGNGRKYSVNALSTTDSSLACQSNPLWIQSVAGNYGLVFPECNPAATAVAVPVSRIRARAGARVADLAAQIDVQQSESAFQSNDLATVLVGQNDVLAQYAQYPAVGEAQLIVNVEAIGAELGRQVNRLADAGARVLIATVTDVGRTPFAAAQNAANADTDRAALLSRLSARLNASMRATIANDGHRIGLVLNDELVQSVVNNVGTGGFTNVTTGVCDLTQSTLVPPSILDCTTATLVAGGTGATYFWADDLHLSSGGQSFLGSLATTRASNNPF